MTPSCISASAPASLIFEIEEEGEGDGEGEGGDRADSTEPPTRALVEFDIVRHAP